MTVNDAIIKYSKSKYYDRPIGKYVLTKDGYILFPKDGLVPVIGTLYYLVKFDGTVTPVHPMLCEFDQDKVKTL